MITTPTYILLLAAKNSALSFPIGDLVFSRGMGILVIAAYYADGQQWSKYLFTRNKYDM